MTLFEGAPRCQTKTENKIEKKHLLGGHGGKVPPCRTTYATILSSGGDGGSGGGGDGGGDDGDEWW